MQDRLPPTFSMQTDVSKVRLIQSRRLKLYWADATNAAEHSRKVTLIAEPYGFRNVFDPCLPLLKEPLRLDKSHLVNQFSICDASIGEPSG